MNAVASTATERRVVQVVRGRPTRDGAGVHLTRMIAQPALDMLDPFLLLDEFGSDSAADYIAGFPDHPHRGFETVTYMLAGRMRHGDNHGNSGLLTAGSVQWMTAGRGIVHSEMPEQEEGLMRGFQLWVNLPAKDKMTAPRYQDIAPERILRVEPVPGAEVRVIAGRFGDTTGPVSGIAVDPLYLDIGLAPGTRLEVPIEPGHNAFAHVFEGSVRIGPEGGEPLAQGELAVLDQGGRTVTLAAGAQGGRLLLVAGRPLGEPVARYGPFVMNTEAQIAAAMLDYQAGNF